MKHRLPDLKNYNFVVYILLAINLYMFYKSYSQYGSETLSGLQTNHALNIGAMYVDHQHNVSNTFSLITSMFAHASLMHIVGNMFALIMFGRFTTQLWGNTATLILYLITGLAGNIATMMFVTNTVSLGASGATFGLSGAALMGALFNPRFKHALGTILSIIAINIVYTFTIPGINIQAHIGGIITGIILGIIFNIIAFIHHKLKTRMPKY